MTITSLRPPGQANTPINQRGILNGQTNFGMRANGSTDDGPAFQSGVTQGVTTGQELYLPAGTYRDATTVAITGGITISGAGPGRTVINHEIAAGPLFNVLGSLNSNKTLSNSPAAATSILQTSTAHGWVAGDLLLIRDSSQPIYGNASRTAEASTGEIRRVRTVDSSSQVTVRGRLENAYTATNTLIAKINPVSDILIRDLTIVNTHPGTMAATARGLLAAYARNIRLENVEFKDFDGAQVYLQTVVGFELNGLRFQDARDLESVNAPYNIIATNGSCDGLVTGCRGWYGRHLFTTGAAPTEPPAQHIRVADCIGTEYTQAVFDTHPGSRWITFSDCEAHGTAADGFQIRGPDSAVLNPTVSQATNGVVFVYGAHRGRVSGGGRISGCDTGVLVQSSDDCRVGRGLLIDSPTTYGLRVVRDAAWAADMTKFAADDIDVSGNPATAAYAFDVWDDNFQVRNLRAPDATTKTTGTPTTPLLPGLFQDGYPGGVAPSDRGAAAASLTLTANQAQVSRFVPERNMTITSLTYAVTTAAGSDDPVDVGIYSLNASAGVLTRLVSLGATTGKLNATGVKTSTVTATKLVGGTVYYVAVSCGAIGTTAATIAGAGFNSTTTNQLMGTGVPNIVAGSKAASHPLPATISGPSSAANGPKMGLLE